MPLLDRAAAAQVLWNTLIGVIPLGGKNSQQIQGAVQKQIKTYQKLMEAFTSTSRAEQALINHVQVHAHPGFLALAARFALQLASILPWVHHPCACVRALLSRHANMWGATMSSASVKACALVQRHFCIMYPAACAMDDGLTPANAVLRCRCTATRTASC